MSALEDVKVVQRLLGVDDDGRLGLKTRAAFEALGEMAREEAAQIRALIPASHPAAQVPTAQDVSRVQTTGATMTFVATPVDSRSEANILTLHPKVQPYARGLIQVAVEQGIDARVISGTRTYAVQDGLYEQGRSKPGPIVTNARGGQSSHNFGTAFDLGLFENGKYLDDSPLYRKVAMIGKSMGLSWGGDWSHPDEPHLYLKPLWAANLSESQMMTELRRRHDAGIDVFA